MHNMRKISYPTVLGVGLTSLAFYAIINFVLFRDFGLVPAGRIVFTSDFGYLDYLLLPLGIFVGILVLRNQKPATFKDLFLFGFKTSLIASTLFSTFIFVGLQFIEPGYFAKLIVLVKQLDSPGLILSPIKAEMLVRARIIEANELFQNPYFYGIGNFFVYLLLGTLSALLFAAIMRKKVRPE